MAGKSEKAEGKSLINFRFEPEVVEQLDELVRAFAEESGDEENRTRVMRKLIKREYQRRFRHPKKSA